MNGVNDKTPESHECKRYHCLYQQLEQRPTRLAFEAKEQHQWRLQLRCREERKGREESLQAEEKSQETQKRLRAQRQRDMGSRHQCCQTAEQRDRRLLDESAGNARHHENQWNNNSNATMDKNTYTTSDLILRDVHKVYLASEQRKQTTYHSFVLLNIRVNSKQGEHVGLCSGWCWKIFEFPY